MATPAQTTDFGGTMAGLFRARFPFLYVRTWEEERLEQELLGVAERLARGSRSRLVARWSITTGMVGPAAKGTRGPGQAPSGATEAALHALRQVEECDEPAIFILRDFHWFFGAHNRPPDQAVIRRIRDLGPVLREAPHARSVVFVAPELVLPSDLDKDVYVVDFDLPGAAEIRSALDKIIADQAGSSRITIALAADEKEDLVNAALGLTVQEAENAFARAMAQDNRLDIDDVAFVQEEKRQAVKKTEVLEYFTPDRGFEHIGGLRNLRQWLTKRNGIWLEAARSWGLPFPKGILITGVPGCGKSLTAKCTSAEWQLPLLRLDVGRIFSGLVGSSEENMRSALRMAEAISPSLLWIDEIEKGFGGAAQGDRDSGTSSRVFATFLTWMQEKDAFVFVIATANSIDRLPPEFLRKGRFDEIFFVDLPTRTERATIFGIHLRAALERSPAAGDLPLTEEVLEYLADRTEGYSGAEIEQIVVAALFDAFAENRRLTLEDLLRTIGKMVPLSITQAERILTSREWARTRAVGAASSEDLAGYTDEAVDGDLTHSRGGRTIDF